MNNMIMLAWFGQGIEDLIGPLGTIFLFLFTGAVGWLTTAVYMRVRYSEEWEIAKFQTSIGSSPATYGFGAFLSAASPCSCTLSACGLPAWVWLPALVCVPKLFQSRYGVQLQSNGGLKANLHSIAFIAASCSISYFVVRPFLSEDCMMKASTSFAVYLLCVIALKAFDSLFLGKSFWIPGSDNTAHFGGAFLGAVAGLYSTGHFTIINQQQGVSQCDTQTSSLILNACLVYLAVVVCFPQAS
jgi:membrane associated rhomboid family serine protease